MSSWNDVTKKVLRDAEKFRIPLCDFFCGSSGICPFAVLCDPGVYPSGGTFVQRIYRTCDPDRPNYRAVRIFRIDFPGVSCPESPGRTHVLPQH